MFKVYNSKVMVYTVFVPQTSGGCGGSVGGAGGSGGARGGSLRTPLARTPVTFNASQVASKYNVYTLLRVSKANACRVAYGLT